MQNAKMRLIDLNKLQASQPGSLCVGQIIHISEEGQALVDYPSNPMGPIKARTIIDVSKQQSDDSRKYEPVLLVFEDSDPALPIIVGFIRETLYAPVSLKEETFSADRPRDAIVDGRKVVLDAKDEVILRCGKSSIKLSKDGKIVVKGTQIVSRASEANKIKGASVRIN